METYEYNGVRQCTSSESMFSKASRVTFASTGDKALLSSRDNRSLIESSQKITCHYVL